jgi:hypothetical protein
MDFLIIKAKATKNRVKKGRKYKVHLEDWNETTFSEPFDCEDTAGWDGCDRNDCASCGWNYKTNKLAIFSFQKKKYRGEYPKSLFVKVKKSNLPSWW